MKESAAEGLPRDVTRFEEGAVSPREFLPVGARIVIEGREYVIERVTLAADLGREFDLAVSPEIPIYWLPGGGGQRKGAFVPEQNIVLFFTNTDRETRHHELVHAVEYFQGKRPELLAFYERAKQVISESSFVGGGVSNNFRKNIHEFIADGKTKALFIEALKKEHLYEEFLKQTDYLFAERNI